MEAPVALKVALIYPNDNGRAVDQERVKAIAESIKEIGLRTPITVRPTTRVADGRDVDAYEILTGRHRYEAARRLGFVEVQAYVSTDDDLHAELWGIDENLMRADLTPADRATCIARRKAIYEELHPETKVGATGVSREKVRQVGEANPADRFTADTARATGQSERAVQRDAERGDKIDLDVMKEIKGSRFDKGVVLDILKKLTAAEQKQALFRVKSGASSGFQDAYDFIRGHNIPPKKPTPIAADPLNDFETLEKQVASLMAAWNKASREARDEFLLRIDRPVFDNTRAA